MLQRWFSSQTTKSLVAPFFDCIQDDVNKFWKKAGNGRRITLQRRPIFSKSAKIFAIGSCFAREIRIAFRARGHDVYPKWQDIPLDPQWHSACRLPEHDDVPFFDTFVIRQEFEQALGAPRYIIEDFWLIQQHKRYHDFPWPYAFKDPYRKRIYARGERSILELSARMSDCVEAGLQAADVVIITLGLTECWRNKANGLYACKAPMDMDDPSWDYLQFRTTEFQENYDNVSAIIDRVRAAFPNKEIVLSVSPVALARTFADEDVVVANMISKATLRAVAGQICRRKPEITYWPSFEYALGADVFCTDARHVRPEAVRTIVDAFMAAHARGAVAEPNAGRLVSFVSQYGTAVQRCNRAWLHDHDAIKPLSLT